MTEFADPGKLWVFTVPAKGGDDSKFREWCAEHLDLFVIVTERRWRAPQVVLHRADCTGLTPDVATGSYLWTCGTRGLLENQFSESVIVSCQMCL